MPFRLVCPSCSAKLSLKDEYAGRAVKCPRCGDVIPAARTASTTATLPPQPEKERTEPAASKGGKGTDADPEGSAPAQPSRRKARDDDDDDRPRKKRRRDDDDDPREKKGGSKVLIVLLLGFLVTVPCCGGIGYFIYGNVQDAREELEVARRPVPAPRPDPFLQNEKVTPANFQKLKPLMTQDEVEAILGIGIPAQGFNISLAFDNHTPAVQTTLREWEPKADAGRVMFWWNGDDNLFVAFHDKPDAGGRLQMKLFVPKGGAAGVIRSGEPDDATFVLEHPELVKGDAPVELFARDLAQAAWDDPGAARTRFADKRLTVRGTITDVSEEPDVEVTVTLRGVGYTELGIARTTGIVCRIKVESERRKAWALSRGQTVALTGPCTQVEKASVTLSNCALKETGPDPAVRLTLPALAAELRSGPAATEKKYQGKEVTIPNAVVVSVDGYTALVVSVGGKETDEPVVRVKGPRSERVGALKPGDRVTVKGQFTACTRTTVDLEEGWVVP